MVMIKLKKVSFAYPQQKKLAVSNVSATVNRETCTALIGANGTGKTTLIQLLAGLLQPTSGEIHLAGQKLSYPLPARQRRQIAILFQEAERQLFERTVFDDVAFYPRQYGLPETKVAELVAQALKAVNLNVTTYGRRSPFSLSCGQMRLVAIAGVLTMDPAVILLDEPFVGLDSQGQQLIFKLMQKWRQQEKTIIFCSHNLANVVKLASHVWVLNDGQLVAAGPTRSIFRQLTLLQSLNLGLPELSQLYYYLKEKSMPLKSLPLTPDEAAQELDSILKARLVKIND